MAYLLAFQHKKAKEKKKPWNVTYHEMKGGGRNLLIWRPKLVWFAFASNPKKVSHRRIPSPPKSEGNFPFFFLPHASSPSPFSFLVRKQCRALVISPFFSREMGEKKKGNTVFERGKRGLIYLDTGSDGGEKNHQLCLKNTWLPPIKSFRIFILSKE